MASFATGNRRLLELASILARIPAAHRLEDKTMRGYDQTIVTHPCGTPACAWGYWLYGSKERYKRLAKEDGVLSVRIKNTLAKWPLQGEAGYVSYYDAGDREFGLTPIETNEIFGGCGCQSARTGKEAAAFIRAFVAHRKQARTREVSRVAA